MPTYQEKKNVIDQWLSSNFSCHTLEQQNIISITLLQLISDLGYSNISIQLLTLLLSYIEDKKNIQNGCLSIRNIFDASTQALIDYANYQASVLLYKQQLETSILRGIFGTTSQNMLGNLLTGPAVIEEFLRSTQLYQQLHHYFTTTNKSCPTMLSNQALCHNGGLDLQSTPPTIRGTDHDDLCEIDLFDTGINTAASNSANWRQRVTTLSFAGNDTCIKRVNADLLSVTGRDINNIIDIVNAYVDGVLISKGTCPDSSYIEGTSSRLKEGDMLVVKSGRFNGDCKIYTYIVIKVLQVNITHCDNDDNYLLDIWRY